MSVVSSGTLSSDAAENLMNLSRFSKISGAVAWGGPSIRLPAP